MVRSAVAVSPNTRSQRPRRLGNMLSRRRVPASLREVIMVTFARVQGEHAQQLDTGVSGAANDADFHLFFSSHEGGPLIRVREILSQTGNTSASPIKHKGREIVS